MEDLVVIKRALALVSVLACLAISAGCANNRPRLASKVPRSNPSRSTATNAPPSRSIDTDANGSDIRLVSDAGTTDVPSDEQGSANSADIADHAPISPTPLGPATMSLSQLEEIALQHNPTLIQAQAEIEVDQGFLKQAGLYPNPQTGYFNDTASNPSVHRANGLFLSQEIVTGRKLQLAQEAIRQEIKQMQWDQVAQQMRVMNDLKIRYFEVLGAQQAVAIAGKLVEVASETVGMTERILEAKEGTRSDVLQARVQLDTA